MAALVGAGGSSVSSSSSPSSEVRSEPTWCCWSTRPSPLPSAPKSGRRCGFPRRRGRPPPSCRPLSPGLCGPGWRAQSSSVPEQKENEILGADADFWAASLTVWTVVTRSKGWLGWAWGSYGALQVTGRLVVTVLMRGLEPEVSHVAVWLPVSMVGD